MNRLLPLLILCLCATAARAQYVTNLTLSKDQYLTGEPVVAMAAGPAFSFGYAEHPELLRAAGARVVEFDPLVERLPADTAALVLPGGFPEQYPGELSGNAALRADPVIVTAADACAVRRAEEGRVVLRFYIVGALLALLTLSTFKLQ